MVTCSQTVIHINYRRIPKISPGAYIFEGLIVGGAYIWRGFCTGGNLCFKIDWASLLLGRKFTISLCFTLNLRAIPSTSPPGGLIFGGAYTWRGLFSEFYSN